MLLDKLTFAEDFEEFDEEIWDEDLYPYTDYEAALDDNESCE